MEMVKDDQEGCHFVLVHGACHGAWCWYKVAAILKSAGHKVTALDMAGCGIHLTQWHMLESFSEYFEPLMEFFKSLQPHEKVILVGHSMGGACISAAMERFPAKISLAVFAAAFMPGPDLSFHDAVQEYTRRLDSYMDSKFMFHEELDTKRSSLVFGPDFLAAKLYQLSPNEDLMLATMLARPTPLFNESILQEDMALTKNQYGLVNRVYVVCDQDNTIREDMQRWMVKNNPPNEVMVISDSDHMVVFSQPLKLCSCLQEMAMKYS